VIAREIDAEAVTFACPGCRAAIPVDAAACERCATRFVATRCEGCQARVGVGEARCERCGRMTGAAATPSVEPMCPSCGVPLEGRDLGDARVLGCPTCRGIFVDHLVLGGWMIDRASKAPAEDAEPALFDEGWRVRYHRCPRCATLMNRVNFASGTGVILDVCIEHGYWLDAGELERMAARVRERGLEGTALARVDAQRKERRRYAELRLALGEASWGGGPAVGDPSGLETLLRVMIRAVFGA
jgi:Zn-finger nucleic acid-binding protein